MATPGAMALIAGLAGRWRIRRRIRDRRTGETGRLVGEATLAPGAEGWGYAEAGTLTLGGRSFAAGRRLLWRPLGAAVLVAFDDGRAFHDFVPRPGPRGIEGRAEHLCGADCYRVLYRFGREPIPARWTAVWQVRGPAKDYLMVTTYAR